MSDKGGQGVGVLVCRTTLLRVAVATGIGLGLLAAALPPDAVAPGPTASLATPRSPVLSDADAASRVRRAGFEPRPENSGANHRVPSTSELAAWRSQTNYAGVEHGPHYVSRVTGNFTGTTGEIMQWGAWKWGFDEDLLRAQAVQESHWRQASLGDRGASYGILQLKSTRQRGTFPLSRDSTAFNVDYALMTLRHCYDGYATWLGNGYEAGDLRGCLGYYYSGRWYDAGARTYIRRVMARLATRDWERPRF